MHEAFIEVAGKSTTVYKVGMTPTDYRHRVHEACIEVARRSTTVNKEGVAPTEYQAQEAYIEV